MIGFAGYFGSGKTLNMTKELKKASEQGAFIITNYNTTFSNLVLSTQEEIINCFREILALRQNKKFIGDLLHAKNKNLYKDIFIGLDEAGIYFNSREYREWNKFPDVMDFLLQCRKLQVEIYYTVQHPALVDINFRRVTTLWNVFKKIPVIPLISREYIFLSPESPNYSSGDAITKNFIWGGKSKIWDMYDTTELCLKENAVKEFKSYPILSRGKINKG